MGCFGVFVLGFVDSIVVLWRGEMGKLLQFLLFYKGWVLGILFLSDGILLVFVVWDKILCFLDVCMGQMLQKFIGYMIGVWMCVF